MLPSLTLWNGDFWTKQYSEKLAAWWIIKEIKIQNIYQLLRWARIKHLKSMMQKQTHTCNFQNQTKMILNDIWLNSSLYAYNWIIKIYFQGN